MYYYKKLYKEKHMKNLDDTSNETSLYDIGLFQDKDSIEIFLTLFALENNYDEVFENYADIKDIVVGNKIYKGRKINE